MSNVVIKSNAVDRDFQGEDSGKLVWKTVVGVLDEVLKKMFNKVLREVFEILLLKFEFYQ
jgi:hypothetical protein